MNDSDLIDLLRCSHPNLRLRVNRNRQTLVSLRRPRSARGYTLSIHCDLLPCRHLIDEFHCLIRQRGRGSFPLLHAEMQRIFQQQLQLRSAKTPPPPMPAGHGAVLCLEQRLQDIHHQYWPALPLLPIRWGRNPGSRALRSIRFGTYRSHPQPSITLHPRLGLAWVPQFFVDHVIHHELCHHAQRCQPRRGESSHSARFRAWEQQFSDYAQARAWERSFVHLLLDPSRYQPQSSTDPVVEPSER